MNSRDRLIELLEQAKIKAQDTIGSMNNGFGAWYADYLLEHGVIVLPCKVGDTVYKCHTVNFKPTGEIAKRTIKKITFSAFTVSDDGVIGWFDIDNIGITIFLTREEAEKALKEGRTNENNKKANDNTCRTNCNR